MELNLGDQPGLFDVMVWYDGSLDHMGYISSFGPDLIIDPHASHALHDRYDLITFVRTIATHLADVQLISLLAVFTLSPEWAPLNVTFIQTETTEPVKEQTLSATIEFLKKKNAESGNATPSEDTTMEDDNALDASPVDENGTDQHLDDTVTTAGATADIGGEDDGQVSLADEAKPKKAPAKKKVTSATAAKAKAEAPAAPVDLIQSTATEIENLTETKAAQQLHELVDNQSFDTFRMGGILAKIQTEGWIGEHPNFRSFVEAEYDIKYRTAMMWISMYNSMVDSGVPWDKVKKLGWTKVSTLAPILTAENVDDILTKVEGMNVTAIKAFAATFDAAPTSAQVNTADTGGEQIKSKSFKLFEGQKETVDLAIDKAKKASGTDSDAVALEFIATDYLSGSKKAPAKAKPTYSFDPEAPMDFDLTSLFEAIRDKADDLPSALNHILTSITAAVPSANISVELDD